MKMLFYGMNSRIGFGKHKHTYICDILRKDNTYVQWCFEKNELFAISIDVFESLDYIKDLKKEPSREDFRAELKRLHDLFIKKLSKYNEENSEDCYYSEHERRLTNKKIKYATYSWREGLGVYTEKFDYINFTREGKVPGGVTDYVTHVGKNNMAEARKQLEKSFFGKFNVIETYHED